MLNSRRIRWSFALLVSVAATALFTSVCRGDDETRDAAASTTEPTQAQQLALVEKLGGAARIVEGRVQGIYFVTNEKFVVGGPNEVITPSVTDESLGVIKSFPHLKVLHIEDAAVTDKGMVHLAALSNLEDLALWRTSVTERGLKHLRHCNRLKRLDLLGMKVSPEGLRPLTTNMALAQSLRELNLSYCTFSDPSLAALESFQSLRTLWLPKTNVSDDAVEHLSKLTKLERVHLNSTQMSPSAIAALARALPKAQIVSEDPAP